MLPNCLELDSIIFDLDGTLWDTRPAFAAYAASLNGIVRRHGFAFRDVTERDIRRVAGRPCAARIRELFRGLQDEQLAQLVPETHDLDRGAFDELGSFVHVGVEAGLKALSRRYPLFIVSNCERGYIERFLVRSQLPSLFTDFECWGNTRRSKADNLCNVIRRNRLRAAAYVGDSEGDQKAAQACGIPFVFAEYGFGACKEATWTIRSFAELHTLVRPRNLQSVTNAVVAAN